MYTEEIVMSAPRAIVHTKRGDAGKENGNEFSVIGNRVNRLSRGFKCFFHFCTACVPDIS